MSAAIASSVAELVSAYPTAGGIYFVTKHVVPPEHVAIWGWIIGWANFLGQAAGVASLAYTIGQMVLAAASINSGITETGYQYSPYVRPCVRIEDLPAYTSQNIDTNCPALARSVGNLWHHMLTDNEEAAPNHPVVCTD